MQRKEGRTHSQSRSPGPKRRGSRRSEEALPLCHHQTDRPVSKQTSTPTGKQAGQRARRQVSKQVGKQASKQASKQPSKQASAQASARQVLSHLTNAFTNTWTYVHASADMGRGACNNVRYIKQGCDCSGQGHGRYKRPCTRQSPHQVVAPKVAQPFLFALR